MNHAQLDDLKRQVQHQHDEIARFQRQLDGMLETRAQIDAWLENPTDINQIGAMTAQRQHVQNMVNAFEHSIAMIELPDQKLARLEQEKADQGKKEPEAEELKTHTARGEALDVEIKQQREICAALKSISAASKRA